MSNPLPNATTDYPAFEQNEKGHWALHYAVMKGDPERVRRYVNERGHPVDAQDFDQNTALHWAIWNRRVDAALALLEVGANPDIANHKGHTALHHLFAKIERGQDQILLDALLDHHANGLAQDKQGNTPYHMLALGSFRSAQAASALADTMCRRVGLEGWRTVNHAGQTPIECARSQGDDHWMRGFVAAVENAVLETATAPAAATRAPGRGRL